MVWVRASTLSHTTSGMSSRLLSTAGTSTFITSQKNCYRFTSSGCSPKPFPLPADHPPSSQLPHPRGRALLADAGSALWKHNPLAHGAVEVPQGQRLQRCRGWGLVWSGNMVDTQMQSLSPCASSMLTMRCFFFHLPIHQHCKVLIAMKRPTSLSGWIFMISFMQLKIRGTQSKTALWVRLQTRYPLLIYDREKSGSSCWAWLRLLGPAVLSSHKSFLFSAIRSKRGPGSWASKPWPHGVGQWCAPQVVVVFHILELVGCFWISLHFMPKNISPLFSKSHWNPAVIHERS